MNKFLTETIGEVALVFIGFGVFVGGAGAFLFWLLTK